MIYVKLVLIVKIVIKVKDILPREKIINNSFIRFQEIILNFLNFYKQSR